MCGIAGIAGLRASEDEVRGRLVAMCDSIFHRGPDSAGYYVDDHVALGMRRLRIIDVVGGDQPIFNETGSIAVVFNGEIYNHHELRRELKGAGHVFRTHTDTEVLVHGYEQYGLGLLSRLRGMYAFAIWDGAARQLTLARDPVGIKPLLYAELGSGLFFGSEIRTLLAGTRDHAFRLDPSAISRFLAFGYVPDPGSVFAGVNKLDPGHLLQWTPGSAVAVSRFWSPPPRATRLPAKEDLVEELRLLLSESVKSHLESEVPLGAFLSGGLDSSTVVALMARHAGGRVKTFSIGFEEKEFDESGDARVVADLLKTDHTEMIVRQDVQRIFEDVVGMFDEPFADISAIPTFLVSQLARQTVTVALSGDGGDELFGGYTRYTSTLGRNEPSILSQAAARLALSLPHGVPGRNRLVDLGRTRWGQYAATVATPVRLDEGGVGSPVQPFNQVRIADQIREPEGIREDFAGAMMANDFRTYLPGDILAKVDRTSMAVSLETRVPLLDLRLVEFAQRLPGEMHVSKAGGKLLLRQAIAAIVPPVVLTRPKRGFDIPLGRWFRGPLRHRAEACRTVPATLRDYVDQRAMNRVVSEHLVGRRDHGALLWRVSVLHTWLEGYAAGRLRRPPSVPTFEPR